MEGVEEIPGSALSVGMSWDWESFPEYMDAIDRQEHSIDIVAQVAHSALRCYVMGQERALDDHATPADIEQMTQLTRQALQAGALGFSTSRTMIHKVKDGPAIPGTFCQLEELVSIAEALRDAGYGVFQMISDKMGKEPDLAWMKEIARTSGRPIVMSLVRRSDDPEGYRQTLASFQDPYDTEGLDLRAGVGWRPPVLHPLVEHVPAGRTARLRARRGRQHRRTGQGRWREPQEYVYDAMLADDGKAFLYYPLQGYDDYSLDPLHEMMAHPRSVASLSDGGAHVGTVADASFCTYMLTHWVRDRHQGERFSLEEAVRIQTSDTAHLYGLGDRGVLSPGKKADVNVIDVDGLQLYAPNMAFDLPGDNKRLLQPADGYGATIVNGEVIAENGQMTGAHPGALVRGPRN